MRKFEKISFDEFCKDISNSKELYDEYNLPKRSTKYSAGYDFSLLEDLVLEPNQIKKIPTGIKASMNDDEVLFIIIRSSLGFKYNVRLTNQVGVIDKDYYNNDSNEGHIYVSICNEGKDTLTLKKGDRFAQGIFIKYLKVDDEEDITDIRTGGTGSTNKEEK